MEEYRVEDEISLKELITILLKGWKLIAGIMALGAIISIVYSFMIAKPVYETKLELFMTIPETKVTEVGTYRYPSNNPTDYFELVSNSDIVAYTMDEYELEGLSTTFVNNLSITQEKDANVVAITYKGGNPEEIAKILNGHVTHYQQYLSYQFREDAIKQFIAEDKVSLSLKQDQLSKNQDQLIDAKARLAEMSPTIPLQKALTTNPEIAAQYARDNGLTVAELSNQLLIEEIVNINYSAAEKSVDNLETTINTLEIEIDALQEQLETLRVEKSILENSDIFEEPTSEFLNVLSLPIKKVAPANVPTNRVSPNRTLNVAIALVLSAMIGILIVFFRAYWKNN